LGLLSFTNFTTEQLTLRVGEVDGSVWLSDQLQLYKNEILVKIAPCPQNGVMMILIIEVLFYILFSLKIKF
jgi:hypothetical protein